MEKRRNINNRALFHFLNLSMEWIKPKTEYVAVVVIFLFVYMYILYSFLFAPITHFLSLSLSLFRSLSFSLCSSLLLFIHPEPALDFFADHYLLPLSFTIIFSMNEKNTICVYCLSHISYHSNIQIHTHTHSERRIENKTQHNKTTGSQIDVCYNEKNDKRRSIHHAQIYKSKSVRIYHSQLCHSSQQNQTIQIRKRILSRR